MTPRVERETPVGCGGHQGQGGDTGHQGREVRPRGIGGGGRQTRKVLPVVAGLFVLGAHIAWHVLSPGPNAPGWADVTPSFSDGMQTYIACGAHWLGASYAVSAAFTAYALSIFRENRRMAAAGAAGGIAALGALYAAGCFAIGCCGSPLLPIYLGLLGGKVAGIGGPVMFGLTLLSVGIGFLILGRKARCGCEGPCAEEPHGQR